MFENFDVWYEKKQAEELKKEIMGDTYSLAARLFAYGLIGLILGGLWLWIG